MFDALNSLSDDTKSLLSIVVYALVFIHLVYQWVQRKPKSEEEYLRDSAKMSSRTGWVFIAVGIAGIIWSSAETQLAFLALSAIGGGLVFLTILKVDR